MSDLTPDNPAFAQLIREYPGRWVPAVRRLLSDSLTPVMAYRALVRDDGRLDPSFLLESVVDGQRIGRYSYLAANPVMQVIARRNNVQIIDATGDSTTTTQTQSDDPLALVQELSEQFSVAPTTGLPDFSGGWVGHVGYDTVRYLEPEKLQDPPPDDRHLPDMHLQMYLSVVVFDHVQKCILLVTHVKADDAEAGVDMATQQLDQLEARLRSSNESLIATPRAEIALDAPPPKLPESNMGHGGYQDAVRKCKRYIEAGDAFQIVPSQRFELSGPTDPFDVYRALRVVNPSPYMFYLQIDGAVLVGSSPEILVHVKDGMATSRPLAGTRRRGSDEAADAALAEEMSQDPKDRAEHIMLVDLHRNDIGRIAQAGSIELPALLAVERYSHVMHLSSTVTGTMRESLTAWDALRVSLPVGTVSGAPKIRAMQIIDELEPTRRGPYAGAVGFADLTGNMDMCIALRTLVCLPDGEDADDRPKGWKYHIQVGAGIVADSDPDAEHQETVDKAAALAKAIELAGRWFGN
jgi:anthranilate synthase component 1